jgi:hypothetical protein
MKTAMQELIFHIAYMERRKYQDKQTQILGGMNDCIMYDAIVIQNRIIEELTKEYSEYLEKEKEQIMNANRQGRCNDCPFMYSNEEAEQYYNQTYKQYGLDDEARQILNNL